MDSFFTWLYVILALVVALAGNSVSAIWASRPHWFNPWLLAVIILGPLVFITFGLVASRVGVAMGSATLDALLTVSTILIGLFLFQEWHKLGLLQYMGIALVVAGIVLMQIHTKVGAA